jgi:hypothetical protein
MIGRMFPPQGYGVEDEPYTYCIFIDDDGYVKAKNGRTGRIDFSSTDATVVIQNALNAAGIGSRIFIKSGTYLVNSPIEIPYDNMEIYGTGKYGTLLKASSSFPTGKAVLCTKGFVEDASRDTAPVVNGLHIHNLGIDGNGIAGYGFNMKSYDSWVDHLYITRATIFCLYRFGGTDTELDHLYIAGGGTKPSAGIRLWAPDNTVRNSIIQSCATGLSLAADQQIIIGNHFWGNDRDIEYAGARALKIIGNHMGASKSGESTISAIYSGRPGLADTVIIGNVIECPPRGYGIATAAWDAEGVFPPVIAGNVFVAGTGSDAAKAGIWVGRIGTGKAIANIFGNTFYGDYTLDKIYHEIVNPFSPPGSGTRIVLNDGYVNCFMNWGFDTAGKSDPVKVVTSDYSASWTDHVILVDASGGPVTVTLPNPLVIKKDLIIKKIDSSANAVTVAPYGSETIDGASLVILTDQNSFIHVISNGMNWYVIGKG